MKRNVHLCNALLLFINIYTGAAHERVCTVMKIYGSRASGNHGQRVCLVVLWYKTLTQQIVATLCLSLCSSRYALWYLHATVYLLLFKYRLRVANFCRANV